MVMGSRSQQSPDYTIRRGEVSAYGRALLSSKQLGWLIAIVVGVLLVLLVVLFTLAWPRLPPVFSLMLIVLAGALLIGMWSIYRYNKIHFIESNLALRKWLQQVCDGELGASLDLDENHPHHKELNFHTNNLATSLRRLSNHMDSLVELQTDKLNDQKQVMELLFNLTAGVSNETIDDAAFVTACRYLAQWFESAQVSCYRVKPDQHALQCIATLRSPGNESTSISIETADHAHPKSITLDGIPEKVAIFEPTAGEIRVPFYAGDQLAGVLIVETDSPRESIHSDTHRILTTVSEQLSLLCTKQLVQEQVVQSRLSLDRNELAAEIHDSLAQTLLAMRYQTTLLGEKLKKKNDTETYQDALKIIGSIEEANEEVRGLIREYRNPLAEHRHADSLQELIDQFSQTIGIEVFFQSDDAKIRFTPREEATLHRILGEALNNAGKYADASMIRVYLQRDASGVRRMLVEDDGKGFLQNAVLVSAAGQTKDTGTQIGLTIMQERALSIGANLTIDSELDEGTRITITMPPLVEPSRVSA